MKRPLAPVPGICQPPTHKCMEHPSCHHKARPGDHVWVHSVRRHRNNTPAPWSFEVDGPAQRYAPLSSGRSGSTFVPSGTSINNIAFSRFDVARARVCGRPATPTPADVRRDSLQLESLSCGSFSSSVAVLLRTWLPTLGTSGRWEEAVLVVCTEALGVLCTLCQSLLERLGLRGTCRSLSTQREEQKGRAGDSLLAFGASDFFLGSTSLPVWRSPLFPDSRLLVWAGIAGGPGRSSRTWSSNTSLRTAIAHTAVKVRFVCFLQETVAIAAYSC